MMWDERETSLAQAAVLASTRSVRPSSESFLIVATTVPITRASCIVVLRVTVGTAIAANVTFDDG